MKRSLLIAAFLVMTISSSAQSSQTFDIATFTPPAGWSKQIKEGAILFATANEAKGTFAMITLYRSGESSGSARNDFESDWAEFVAGQLGVKEKPEVEPVKQIDGWDSVVGASAFKHDDLGSAIVVLNTFSGFGKSFSVVGIFNSADYLPAIESFSSSLKLKKPNAIAKPAATGNNSSESILGTWGVTQSNQSAFSVNNAVMSYIAREYLFNADGTYRFISRAYDPFSAKLLFGKEVGTYRISGDLLTITPKSSVLEGWSRKNNADQWGVRLESQNRRLETVTYRFSKHYFSGIDKTSLILTADNPTQRDGPYVGGGAFQNAWIYSPPCQQCFIEMPR